MMNTHSDTKCLHTIKEIVPVIHEETRGVGADGCPNTVEVTEYIERCMTCGIITQEHAQPIEEMIKWVTKN
jgi:hypothetical protein